jgi:hypothetical protein
MKRERRIELGRLYGMPERTELMVTIPANAIGSREQQESDRAICRELGAEIRAFSTRKNVARLAPVFRGLLARARHLGEIDRHDQQSERAEDRRDDVDLVVMEERPAVRPVAEYGRTEPGADPAHGDLGAERPKPGRYVVVEAVMQDAGNHQADDEQDQEADEIHADHVGPLPA